VSAHREPGWVSLLAQILRDTPRLADAACSGRWTLHDPAEPYEDEEHVEYRQHHAVTICNTCAALDSCRAWVDGLPHNRRPSGVVAGRHPDGGRAVA
jgi:hypothetical protein